MKLYLGENIKRLRMKKQITQEQLAVAMGVTCAAVSKWERENTLPDITLLPNLAHYFGVTIDELIGYDEAKIEREIERFFEQRTALQKDGKWAESIELTRKAYENYPNDHRVMSCYMWDKAGDYADNDTAVLLANKEEFETICERILTESNDLRLRLDAVNMKGKLLHAEGKTEQAVALYQAQFPDWYLTKGQKTEQLFSKDTPEFARQLRQNMLELGAFAVNKKCKEIWFCTSFSMEEKGALAIAFCNTMKELSQSFGFYEADYYCWCFAQDFACKLSAAKGDESAIRSLENAAQEAKQRFIAYGRTDETIGAFCKKMF
ncbi:MAG: helix-turn-helix transcriptional regulator [Clostridia bacterium]|nr:helix-turn-helix transcriptional regulator [Clostridia bacterium]